MSSMWLHRVDPICQDWHYNNFLIPLEAILTIFVKVLRILKPDRSALPHWSMTRISFDVVFLT